MGDRLSCAGRHVRGRVVAVSRSRVGNGTGRASSGLLELGTLSELGNVVAVEYPIGSEGTLLGGIDARW